MKQQTISSQLDMAPVIFPKPPSRDEEEGTQRSIHILESLRRHRKMVSTVLLAFLVLSAFLLWKRRHPLYEATSRIYVSPATPRALSDAAPQIGSYESFVEEQIKTVTRYDVLQEALQKLPAGTWAYWGATRAARDCCLTEDSDHCPPGRKFRCRDQPRWPGTPSGHRPGEYHYPHLYRKDASRTVLRTRSANSPFFGMKKPICKRNWRPSRPRSRRSSVTSESAV